MPSKSKTIAELIELDGDIVVSALDNVDPSYVSDKPNASTGGFTLPTGTTAQRPGTPDTGETRYNSETGSVEFYDGTAWIATNLIPTVDSVSGSITDTFETTLTLSLSNATDNVDVVFKEGSSTLATVSGVSVSSGSASVAVPSAVYGQTAGDTISISVKNSDGTPSSNSQTKTVIAAPTGGTVSTTGNYRVHTFTSSGNFVVSSGFAGTMEYLIVAGGGSGGGRHGGGGGAGGMLTGSTSVSATTHTITVGAGGAGGKSLVNAGGNSSAIGLTAIGGGYGGQYVAPGPTGANGGSGGGAGSTTGTQYGGNGTAGQGNDGGDSYYQSGSVGDGRFTGGGGGAGAVGGQGDNANGGSGNGGSGTQSNIDGNNYYYAAGGGGGWWSSSDTSRTAGDGGQGGGGGGGWSILSEAAPPNSNLVGTGGTGGRNNGGTPATTQHYSADGGDGGQNTGSGGGGNGQAKWGNYNNAAIGSGSGGSGIVIIRYDVSSL